MKTQEQFSRSWPLCQGLTALIITLTLAGSSAWAGKPPKPPPEPQTGYRLVGLGIGGSVNAHRINRAGWVVGKADDQAFVLIPEDTDEDGINDLWFRDTDPEDGVNDLVVNLGSLGGGADGTSTAYGVNEAGQVVGISFPVRWEWDGHAILWQDANGNRQSDPGEMIDLVRLDDSGYSVAVAINKWGQVVGMAASGRAFVINPEDRDGDTVPDTWFADENGDTFNDLMIDLGIDAGGYPVDINDLGEIVGTTGGHGFLIRPDDTNGDQVPDRWVRDDNDDDINDLMILLPPWDGATGSSATAINENGVIAGDSGGDLMLWEVNSSGAISPLNLGHIREYQGTGANDLNDVGQVLGRADTLLNRKHHVMEPCLYENGSLVKLADRVIDWGPFVEPGDGKGYWQATAINNRGEIVGPSIPLVNGGYDGFIAIPVSQP